MKDKIAFVCQRYGLEVNGGSELLCRQLAEKLTPFYEVNVYTTCAVDYLTWDNFYAPGIEVINGVIVHRFDTAQSRNLERFGKINNQIFSKQNHSMEEEKEWLEEQGPVCDSLLHKLWDDRTNYKAVIFMTYLYYLTAKGMLMGLNNTILIPTAHDEAPIYLHWYDQVFGAAKGIVWNTIEEKNFAEKRFPQIKNKPYAMGGAGVDISTNDFSDLPELLQGQQYLVYAGRIDEFKGCREMFNYFFRYKKQNPGNLKLVLMGKPAMPIPKQRDIIYLGFVSDEMKFAVMKEAKALVLFSPFESLSMVVLESMAMGRPVLVNGKCAVLKGHCLRSNAGLYFENYDEFALTLNYLLTHEAEYEVMRQNGKCYIKENYQWNKIINRIIELIDIISN